MYYCMLTMTYTRMAYFVYLEILVALMSRPIAGVRHKTLILTLPGSPKGAEENLIAVLKLLPHACQQAAGADSRTMHAGGVKKLEEEAGIDAEKPAATHAHHHHDHSHGHGGHTAPKSHTRAVDRPISNDPRAGPSARHRKSPYPILAVEDALKAIVDNTGPPQTEDLTMDSALPGHFLAEDVHAGEAVPAFRASIVDGYAVIVQPDHSSTNGDFPVASVSHAAPGEIPDLHRGEVARITTGAPLPPNSNAVVMVEDTIIKSLSEDGREERVVEILTDAIKPNENVREIGSDIKAGQVILKRGEEITSVGGEIGLLASVGKSTIKVYRKPTVGVLSTGDEIVPHHRSGPLRLGEVRDCNRPTLMAAISFWGYKVVDLGIASDEYIPTSPGSSSLDSVQSRRLLIPLLTREIDQARSKKCFARLFGRLMS